MGWGRECQANERFGAAGSGRENIACERATYTLRYAGPSSAFLSVFRDHYGPTLNAFDAADKDGRRDDLQAELDKLFASENRGVAESKEISANYLQCTGLARYAEFLPTLGLLWSKPTLLHLR